MLKDKVKKTTKLSLKERLIKKREDLKKGSGAGDIHLIGEGKTRMRLLPVGEEKEFAIEATTFYLGDKLRTVISPVTLGKECAIMKAYKELSNSKDPDDRELAKKFKPGRKFYAPAIKYKDEKAGKEIDEEAGVRLVVLASGLYDQLLELYLDEEFGDMTDVETGYDIKFTRTGKGKQDTEYGLIRCNPRPLNKKYAKKTYDPEEMLTKLIPTFEETESKIEEYLSLPQEDEAPVKKKSGLKKKKKKSTDL